MQNGGYSSASTGSYRQLWKQHDGWVDFRRIFG